MLRSLYNGVSGIKTHGVGIDVTADNISNINNIGFRGSRPEFKSIFYQTSIESGYPFGSNQIGLGATMQTTALDMSQGNLINTERSFDLAIAGNGYFGIQGRNGDIFYTRNGAFDVDKEGNLVTNNGEFVIGTVANFTQTALSETAKEAFGQIYNQTQTPILDAYTADQKTSLTLGTENTQKPIKLPKYMYLPPVATSYVNFKGTLDSRDKFKDSVITLTNNNEKQNLNNDGTVNLSGFINDNRIKPGDNIQITIKDKNSNSQTINALVKNDGSWSAENLALNNNIDKTLPLDISINATIKEQEPNIVKFNTDVISPNGDKNKLELEFTKQYPNPTEGHIWQVKASLFSPNNTLLSSSNGELVFDGRGMLKSSSLGNLDNNGALLNINFGIPGNNGASNAIFGGMVSREEKSKITDIQKDGAYEGLFEEYHVGDNGSVYARFSNSANVEVAKIPIFHFQNEQGLHKVGGNLFTKTSNSGEPIFYKDSKGNLVYGAQIKSNFLEQSNVDLGEQLTELIVFQKGFDASSKSITTSNEMLKTAIGLKK